VNQQKKHMAIKVIKKDFEDFGASILKAGDKLQKADGSHLTIDQVEHVLLDTPVMV
jgi:hypothetical protein